MNTENLIRMANDISAFFDSEAGADAPAQIASHITRFWDPRMRTGIIAQAAANEAGFTASALAAVKLLVPPGPRPL
ncbi:MAG: formate dehydrogenase subunit delta [Proteobacteria bacterium]|nr:formate dehydrogenase subunit delta [Pseudomonadota bacterium]